MNYIEELYKSRKNIYTLIKNRGYECVNNVLSMDEIRLGVEQYGLETLDIHIVNSDRQLVVRYIDNIKQNVSKIISFLFEGYQLNTSDELILIDCQMSHKVPYDKYNQIENTEYENVRIVSLKTLQFNIIDNILVPKHRLLSKIEKKSIKKQYYLESYSKIPILRFSDPISRYYGYKTHDMIEINRKGTIVYRYVAHNINSVPRKLSITTEKKEQKIELSEQVSSKEVLKSMNDSDPLLPVEDDALPDSALYLKDLGRTYYVGKDYNSSYHGYTINLLKSMIQKEIRRCVYKGAVWVAGEICSIQQLYVSLRTLRKTIESIGDDELDDIINENMSKQVSREQLIDRCISLKDRKKSDTFSRLDWIEWCKASEKNIHSGINNFLHRLMIISVEDCFSGWLPKKITKHLQILLQYPHHPLFEEHLLKCIVLMVYSPKIRLTSDVKAAYLLTITKPPFSKAIEMYNSLLTNPTDFGIDDDLSIKIRDMIVSIKSIKDEFNQHEQELIKEYVKETPLQFILKEKGDILTCSLGIVSCLKNSSDHSMYWINELFKQGNNCNVQIIDGKTQSGKSKRSKQCIYLIWKILLEYTKWKSSEKEVYTQLYSLVKILRYWYFFGDLGNLNQPKILPESRLFVYYSYLLFNRVEQVEFSLDTEMSIPDIGEFRLSITSEESNQMRIPGYVKDIHVRKESIKINKQIEEMKSRLDALEPTEFFTTYSSRMKDFVSEVRDYSSIESKFKSGTLSKEDIMTFLTKEVRDHIHFAKIASRVNNESIQFLKPEYRAIYIAMKGKQTDVSSQISDIISYASESQCDQSDDSHEEEKEQPKGMLSLDLLSNYISMSGSDDRFMNIPSYTIDQDQEDIITNSPQGQVLCGKGKVRVLLFSDYIVKGPYDITKKGHIKKLENNIIYTDKLSKLEDSLLLPEEKRASLPWDAVLEIENRKYLVAKNVGGSSIQLMENPDTKLEQGRKVACDGSYVDSIMSLINKKTGGDISHLTKPIIDGVLQHLYLRYVLNIGDTSLRNILLRKDGSQRIVAGIDLEEQLSKTPQNTKLHMLFGSGLPRKEIRGILIDHIGDIIEINEETAIDLDSDTGMGLENLYVEVIKGRVKRYHSAEIE